MTAAVGTEQKPPTQLPSGLDPWLLDCLPVTGCDICAANWRQLAARKQLGDIARAVRHATEIRDHASGVHGSP